MTEEVEEEEEKISVFDLFFNYYYCFLGCDFSRFLFLFFFNIWVIDMMWSTSYGPGQ